MANNALYELASKIYHNTATDVELADFRDVMAKIKAKGASPQAVWELNQIIVKQANELMGPKLNWLQYVAETQTVDHGKKIEFRIPRGKMNMRWTARGVGVDYTRVGYIEKFSAEPMKIAGGAYYEYDQLLSGSTEGFKNVVDMMVEDMENKILAKAIDTLHTAMASAPDVNTFSAANPTLDNFDSVASVVQRYNRKASAICDVDFAKKMAKLVAAGGNMSDGMKDAFFQNGLFTNINGVDVVTFNNSYLDKSNTTLAAPRRYMYIMPAGADKPLKIGFEGGMYQLTEQDIDTERVFLKVGQKISVDVVGNYYCGELEDTSLA